MAHWKPPLETCIESATNNLKHSTFLVIIDNLLGYV